MRQKSVPGRTSSEKAIKDIRRATRKHHSAEEKIRIVLDGLRGEGSIAELCRREGTAQSLYYKWSKDFLEAGKKRLAGDTARAATTDEVRDLRRESRFNDIVCNSSMAAIVLGQHLSVAQPTPPVLVNKMPAKLRAKTCRIRRLSAGCAYRWIFIGNGIIHGLAAAPSWLRKQQLGRRIFSDRRVERPCPGVSIARTNPLSSSQRAWFLEHAPPGLLDQALTVQTTATRSIPGDTRSRQFRCRENTSARPPKFIHRCRVDQHSRSGKLKVARTKDTPGTSEDEWRKTG